MFKKGQSGNPSGRPKKYKTVEEVEGLIEVDAEETAADGIDVAKRCSGAMSRVLVAIARSEDVAPKDRILAAMAILDRAHGKPVAPILAATENNVIALNDGSDVNNIPNLINVAKRESDRLLLAAKIRGLEINGTSNENDFSSTQNATQTSVDCDG